MNMPLRLPRRPPAWRTFAACAVGTLLLVLCSANVAVAHLVVMHGYADYTSALLWVQADAPGPIRITWRSDHDARAHELTLDAQTANDDVVVARLTGLAPGRRATYAIDGDGEHRDGALRAQPYWTGGDDAPDITIAIGSCFFLAAAEPPWSASTYGGGYEIFDAIAAMAPDLMVWMGDNLYFQAPDEFDPASMAARYRRQRAQPSLARLLVAAPQLAIWDDHDYGPNDADMSYGLKGESLALFKRYWANPSYGLPDIAGRLRTRALRRRRPVSPRRSLVPLREQASRRTGQDDVRCAAIDVAAQCARLFARAAEARRQRHADVESREPLRGIQSLLVRAEVASPTG